MQVHIHCATSKSSLWYMGYVPMAVPLNAHASIVQVYCGAFEHPRISCTIDAWVFKGTCTIDAWVFKGTATGYISRILVRFKGATTGTFPMYHSEDLEVAQ